MVTDTNIDPLTEAQLNILRGNFQLNNLPSIEPRIIRIFVCAPYEGNLFLIESTNCPIAKLLLF